MADYATLSPARLALGSMSANKCSLPLMIAQSDEYPERIREAIEALLERGTDAGREKLEAIGYPVRHIAKRPGLTRAEAGRVFLRDRFACRYCGRLTILTSVMELVATVYPDIFPFHPNWKGGLTHPAIITRSAVVDHVVPGVMGGDWHAADNLVTACWSCNARKGDLTLVQIGGSLREISADTWDGLTSLYPSLWEVVGKPKPRMHLEWMKCVGVRLPSYRGDWTAPAVLSTTARRSP